MNLRLTLLLLISLSLSSCITIIESYTFHNDGSGQMEYIVDMSEISSLMKMGGGLDEQDDLMGQSKEEWGKKLAGIQGITNTSTVFDEDEYMFTVSFDFSSPDALNKALNDVLQIKSEEKIFHWNGSMISRKHQPDTQMELLNEMKGDEQSEMVMSLFQDMKYVCKYQFDKKVKVFYSSPAIGFDKSGKKEWVLETNMEQLVENPTALNVGIVLR